MSTELAIRGNSDEDSRHVTVPTVPDDDRTRRRLSDATKGRIDDLASGWYRVNHPENRRRIDAANAKSGGWQTYSAVDGYTYGAGTNKWAPASSEEFFRPVRHMAHWVETTLSPCPAYHVFSDAQWQR